MNTYIDIQLACDINLPITEDMMREWAISPLDHFNQAGELTLRIVSPKEIQALNKAYRKKDKPTNVLAFPASVPENIDLDLNLLGDVIICADVLADEALKANKNPSSHCAHIIIHGVLHLLGYDHIKDDEAEKMQALEAQILQRFDIDNPYSQKES